ncbi:hypothetical protein [Flagellimonas sp. GZD32]|uniref:hypothetical protein n=1 Tax=Flagellimonas cixiensis TaxID=3228750 RepID=UPI0035C90D54
MKIISKKNYVLFLGVLFLLPNIFVVVLGIESFPFTSAPMFGHYVNDDSNLYLLKFEGHNKDTIIELVDYYGKSEYTFVRHFYGKAYGSSEYLTPFADRIFEDEDKFNKRLKAFFENYNRFLQDKHNLHFQKIEVKIAKVDKFRNNLSDFETFGIYDFDKGAYFVIDE